MKPPRRRSANVAVWLAAVASCGLLAVGAPAADPPEGAPSAEEVVAEPAAGESGVRAFLDPRTGELVGRPSREALDAELPGGVQDVDHWLNTYAKDLVQEPLPGGGWQVDLKGRFRTALVATIDPETGEVSMECVPEAGDE